MSTDTAHGGVTAYYAVFAALLILTAITVAVAYMDLGAANSIVAVAIAVLKACLVLVFFMHLRFSSRLTWLWAGLGFFWLAVLIAFTIADEVSRAWLTHPG
jgi:cytochrome c oxidase subunit IV